MEIKESGRPDPAMERILKAHDELQALFVAVMQAYDLEGHVPEALREMLNERLVEIERRLQLVMLFHVAPPRRAGLVRGVTGSWD